MEKNNENGLENSIKEFATKLYPEKNFDSFFHKIYEKYISLATMCFSKGYQKCQDDYRKLKKLRAINFKRDFNNVLNDINKMIDEKHKK